MTLLDLLKRQREALITRDDDILAQLADAYTGIAGDLSDRIEALQEKMLEALLEGQEIKPSWVYQQERYQSLLDQAYTRVAEFAATADQLTQSQQRAGVLAAAQNLQEQLENLGITGNFYQLPTAALDTLIGFLADGSPITEHFAKMPGVLVEELQRTLVRGIAAGDGPRVLAYQLRKTANLPLDSALRTARTEHLRAYNTAALETYKENSNVVTGWQWMATLGRSSGRTCPYCLAMHGTVHALGEPFIAHVQCRCSCLPITRSGPPITQDGESWLREQSQATQEAILGKAAAKAWREGEVSLSDFAGTKDKGNWGEQGVVRSLKQARIVARKS